MKPLHYFGIIIAAAVVILDQFFKQIALTKLPMIGSFVHDAPMTFALHKNMGVAFNIPIPLSLILVLTSIACLVLACIIYREFHKQPLVALWGMIVLIGALGNLIDRLTLGFTVDYIALFGRSIINLSDVVITVGIIGLFVALHPLTKEKK